MYVLYSKAFVILNAMKSKEATKVNSKPMVGLIVSMILETINAVTDRQRELKNFIFYQALQRIINSLL